MTILNTAKKSTCHRISSHLCQVQGLLPALLHLLQNTLHCIWKTQLCCWIINVLFCLTRMSWGSLCLAPAGHARCFRVNTSLRNKDENLDSILALYWCYDNHLHIPVINSLDLQLLGFSSWVVIKLEKAAYSSLCKNSVLPRYLKW